MTAIAGYTDGKTVFIGGDSAGTAGYSLQTRTDCKVFKNGEMVMGFTSSFRMGQILQYHLSIPKRLEGQEDYEYMVKQFIPTVKAALKEHGYESSKNGNESGGTFLVGYRGKLYCVENDYQVGSVYKNYHACGCGTDLILGALFALEQSGKEIPEQIKLALAAASEFSSAVKPPFTIMESVCK